MGTSSCKSVSCLGIKQKDLFDDNEQYVDGVRFGKAYESAFVNSRFKVRSKKGAVVLLSYKASGSLSHTGVGTFEYDYCLKTNNHQGARL